MKPTCLAVTTTFEVGANREAVPPGHLESRDRCELPTSSDRLKTARDLLRWSGDGMRTRDTHLGKVMRLVQRVPWMCLRCGSVHISSAEFV